MVLIATPNHWHSLMSIWECQAGKWTPMLKNHLVIICLKAENLWKRRKNTIASSNTVRRTGLFANGRPEKEIASGNKGKLKLHWYLSQTRGSIGFKDTKNPPSELDFDVWTGPAPKENFHENLVHYNWHWFWNYGNGDIGNQEFIKWILPLMIPGGLAQECILCGWTIWLQGSGRNRQHAIGNFDYGESLLVFDVRGLSGKSNMGVSQSCIISIRMQIEKYQKSWNQRNKDPLQTWKCLYI